MATVVGSFERAHLDVCRLKSRALHRFAFNVVLCYLFLFSCIPLFHAQLIACGFRVLGFGSRIQLCHGACVLSSCHSYST